jgi:hypothetical protein
MKASQFAINFYLDYFNNYLTVNKFAEDNNISEIFARQLIAEGMRLHDEKVKGANENMIALIKKK